MLALRVVELLAGLKPGAYIQGSPRLLRGEPVTCRTYLLGLLLSLFVGKVAQVGAELVDFRGCAFDGRVEALH